MSATYKLFGSLLLMSLNTAR